MNQRKARNRITLLKREDGSNNNNIEEIENLLVKHFNDRFYEPNSYSFDSILENLSTLPIPKLSQQQVLQLDSPISNDEIEMAVFQLGAHKSPGPDGIPAFFFQEYWAVVKQDILNSTQAVFHSGSLLKALNKTFITLILKVSVPEEVTQFRLISLCNVTYKIITKIMVNRLKPLMNSLILPSQNAFIQGRNISDNILLAHEIMDTMGEKMGRKKGYGALKVDMCKAYDRVSWNFLRAVLTTMNFSSTWINWIMECISLVQYAILLNGSPTQFFHPSRALRQGDPISPYLFLLCTNILSIALTQAERQKQIMGITVGRRGVTFTHLLFADDSIFFFENDNQSLSKLKEIIMWYCSLSSQCINFAKSNLFCTPNIPTNIQQSLVENLRVNLVLRPSKYLGTDFKLRGRRVMDFQDLVD